ncbi:MAG: sialate O-acetylesterase [Bryobacteraceae bacterium]
MRLILIAAAAAVSLFAELKLPAIVSDHMLLQRGVPVRIFGFASPGESVTVKFQDQTVTDNAGPQGQWHVWLKPMEAGVNGDMTIAASNTITVRDVLVGEVWVGSGQSNMQWAMRQVNNAEQEMSSANYPNIRLFRVPLKTSDAPQMDVEAKWEVCTPDSVKGFSAVLYFFGRGLHKQMNVPFGLIQTAYGGTPVQAWTSREALHSDPALFPMIAEWNRAVSEFPEASAKYHAAMKEYDIAKRDGKSDARRPVAPRGPGHAHQPSGLYNAMVHPLVPYTIKGAIWYQGESNASRVEAPIYRRAFETMIQDWRTRWGIGEFPFFWVQLANFEKAGSPKDWVLVQEEQTKTLELRNTAQAVINDIGEPGDIHPKNKQDVGARLALAARHIAYRETQVVYSGPRFKMATREAATTGDRGIKMRVWFDSVGGGLKARSGALKGFEVAGPDKQFHAAEARIDGQTIVVSSPDVAEPVAVRYAWAANPDANLVNAEGLPASCFRSVSW